MEDHTAYDYRMYDDVWQRVSPGCDPYGDIHAAQQQRSAGEVPAERSTPRTLPSTEREAVLPGAQLNPCCMGSEAMESVKVLEGFIEEELTQRRCYLALAARLRHSGAARLLRSLAQEKCDAARELKSAYFLITASCYETVLRADGMRWSSIADALRACYHWEACNGFNYRRAADEALDPCLQKLLGRLSDQAFARADALMTLLGQMIC